MATASPTTANNLHDTVDFDESVQKAVVSGLDQIHKNWGWIVAAGVVSIVAGTAAVALPLVSSLAVEFVVATLILAGGIAAIFTAFYARRWGGFFVRLASGLLHVAVGIAMVMNPVAGLISLTVLVALFFGIDGALKILGAIESRKYFRNWGWVLAGGIVTVIFSGIIASQMPVASLVLVGTLAGIHLIFGGWAQVLLGLEAKQLPESSEA